MVAFGAKKTNQHKQSSKKQDNFATPCHPARQ
jgi:hypothetical protein